MIRSRRALWGIRLLLAALILAVAAAEGWLVLEVVHSARQEEALRHQLVAERLFDDLEEELGQLVEQEERRSFLEYRYLYAPEGQVSGAGLVRSPLAKQVKDERIAGYFQVEPDKTVTNPNLPRANELELAQDNWGDEVPTALPEQLAELNTVVGNVDWETVDLSGTEQLADDQAPAIQQLAQRGGSLQSLNRAAEQRQQKRRVQKVQTGNANLDVYRSDDELPAQQAMVQQAISPVLVPTQSDQAEDELEPEPEPVPEPVPDTAPVPVPHTVSEPYIAERLPPREQPENTEPIEVSVTPMEGVLEEDLLLLARTVRIGDEEWRQGLALRVPALSDQLGTTALGGTELEPWVSLSWQDAPASQRDFTFSHTFAPPFQDLHATASLGRIPWERTDGGPLQWLVGALALLTLLGALALYRMMANELEFAQRRSDFVAAVSHELKSPLTAIRMYGEMLRDGMVPSDERKQTYYATITSESERLTRLIANVLELSRLERGTRESAVQTGSVGPILDELAQVLGAHARARGFELVVDVPDDLPPVSYERDALLQVLVNLVDNAVKFSGDAEDRRILVRAHPQGVGVALEVRDHGPGVPRRQLSRIFQPFWRGERELTRKTKGTGIGLALVKGLVEDMGGSVSARNHPEGGFEVRIVLAGTG